jgi:outer membrane protein assembly factor BamD
MVLLGATASNAQISQILHKKKVDKSTSPDNNAQPDKVLYDRAQDDIKHGRHEVGRLNMQTLINTYPDSEYLAKAKLAIADSYFKEGGTANLALAISSYKDFGVFFPFLPEATYAQMQVAMAHYRQMEKPDRDRAEALAAEEEFQVFIQKYPNDPLVPQAQQHLREVQEVLAEGDYRIGYYYYVKGDKRAAAARLLTVVNRYPLYSKSDRALWMMGDIFERSEHKEIASLYYSRIVKNYPLSTLVGGAKDKLKAFGTPVPQPDPNAVAWMTAEQNTPRPKESLIKRPLKIVKSGPDDEERLAARTGAPNMTPPTDSMSAGELLTGGARSTLGTPGSGLVATVATGSTGAVSGETTTSTDSAAPATDGTTTTAPATEAPKDQPAPGAEPPAGAASNAAVGSAAPAATPAAGAAPAPAAAATEDAAKSAPATGTATGDAAAKPADGAAPAANAAKTGNAQATDDSKKESTSKKKKGLKKLLPW